MYIHEDGSNSRVGTWLYRGQFEGGEGGTFSSAKIFQQIDYSNFTPKNSPRQAESYRKRYFYYKIGAFWPFLPVFSLIFLNFLKSRGVPQFRGGLREG